VGEHRHVLDNFAPWKETRYTVCRRLGGSPGRSGRVRKISPPRGFDPRTVQLVASGYTDRVICGLTSFGIDRPCLMAQGGTVFKIPSFKATLGSAAYCEIRGSGLRPKVSCSHRDFYRVTQFLQACKGQVEEFCLQSGQTAFSHCA